VNARAGDEGDPRPVGEALDALRAELGLPADDALARLEARWREVVGDDVAAHARIARLRDGTLTVAVDSPPWATQLTYLEAVLVERAAAVAGEGVVRTITVVVRPEFPSDRRRIRDPEW
jgi:predicted nucleic acid-binding Zn ribbon protein